MNGKCLTVCLILIGICLSTVLGDLHDEIEEAENASNDGFEEDEYASRDDEPSREERRRKRPIVHCAQDDVESCWPPHDACDSIPAGESKYNLTNTQHINVWNCDCEFEFYKCLHRVNSNLSNRLGELYFLLQKKCFRKSHPIFDCSNFDAVVGPENSQSHRCIRYILVLNEPEQYQWFDLPFYMGKRWQSSLYIMKDGRY